MKLLLAALLFLSASLAHGGEQTVIRNYATAQRDFFWTKLYTNGGRDLYCNVRFIPGERLTVEHVYAADWIATHHDCPDRDNCPVAAYGFAEADLHNLWPAIGAINSSLGDKPFGEIPGNKATLPPNVANLKCDYERTTASNHEPRQPVTAIIAVTVDRLQGYIAAGLPQNDPDIARTAGAATVQIFSHLGRSYTTTAGGRRSRLPQSLTW